MIKFTLIFILAVCATKISASFIDDLLADQNAYRTPLNLDSFTWSNDLAQTAQAWAEHLASIGKLLHSSTKNGENLAYITGTYNGDTNIVSGSSSTTPSAATTNPSNTENANSGNAPSETPVNTENPVETAPETSNTQNAENPVEAQSPSPSEPSPEVSQPASEPPAEVSQPASEGNKGDSDASDGHWTSKHSHVTNSVDRFDFQSNDGGNSDGRKLFSVNNRKLDENSDSQLSQLVGLWGAEKQYFTYGTFPDVSITGEWTAVGHYTQLIWGETKQVGCGIANGNGNIFLVCQYYPAGNWDGETPY